jgi:DNA topoisomerase-3
VAASGAATWLVAPARGQLVQLGVRKDDDPGFNLARRPVVPPAQPSEAVAPSTLEILASTLI